MNQGWRKQDGVWKYSSLNDNKRTIHNEFKSDLPTLNKAILYLPTHNTNDVIEWYRLYKDAYLYKDPNIVNKWEQNYVDNIGHGVGITMYANKDRAKTIKAWFPNLVEVKATSCNNYEYKYENNNYLRYSKDYIENLEYDITTGAYFKQIEKLKIDDVDILSGERVLLKNQFVESLKFIDNVQTIIDSYLDEINNSNKTIKVFIYKDEYVNYNNLFKTDDILICINSENELNEILLSNIKYYDDLNDPNYVIYEITLNTQLDISNIIKIANRDEGIYTYTSYKNQNGVYKYLDGELRTIPEMNMFEKVYNQLVYTYQGTSSTNNVYYLRRHDEKFHPYYTQYPCTKYGLDMEYSLGNPHLIECEVTYDVALEPFDMDNIAANCQAYNVNFGFLDHPTGSPEHYDIDDNIFRLLYMDNDMARKLQTKSNIGPVNLSIDENNILPLITLDNSNNVTLVDIIKFPVSALAMNALNKYIESNSFSISEIIFEKFDTPIDLSLEFDAINNLNALSNNKLILNKVNSNSSYVTNELVRLKIVVRNVVKDEIVEEFDNILHITDFIDNGTAIEIEFEKEFDDNIINGLFLKYCDDNGVLNSDYEITGEIINITEFNNEVNIGDIVTQTPGNNNTLILENSKKFVQQFFDVFNNTIIGHIYDFGYELVTEIVIEPHPNPPPNDPNATIEVELIKGINLKLNKIRNNFNKYVYHNLLQEIEIIDMNNISYTSEIIPDIASIYSPYYRYELNDNSVHVEPYTIDTYLNKYFEYGGRYDTNFIFDTRIDNLTIATFIPTDWSDITQKNNYFELVRPFNDMTIYNNQVALQSPNIGTIIYYGKNHKENLLKYIKPNTYCKISYLDEDENNIKIDTFIYSNEYNYVDDIGRIVIRDFIEVVDIGDTIAFEPQFNVEDLSLNLEKSFNRIDNIGNNELNPNVGQTNDPTDSDNFGQYINMKPSTFGHANDIINDRERFPHLTGVVYKEFNEPVYTFFKRDKKFKFDEDELIEFEELRSDLLKTDFIPSTNGNYYEYIGSSTITLNIDDTFIFVDNGYYLIRYLGQDVNNNANMYKFEEIILNTYYKDILNNKLYYVIDDNDNNIILVEKEYQRKKDDRLSITFKRIAKLGVDNEHQPFRKISESTDSSESVENLIGVGLGFGGGAIRFIDGLSYDNIMNNINGQGQYAWILHPNVITQNAVVGQGPDPVTGEIKLIWYTGTWVDGVWCDGIWIQGLWINGIWVNGYRYSYDIIDYYSSVDIIFNSIIDNLSIWKKGKWVNGTNYNGIFEYVNWENGYLEGGTIMDGVAEYMIFNGNTNTTSYNSTPSPATMNGNTNGVIYSITTGNIEHIIWKDGIMYSGHFETGLWKKGLMFGGVFGLNAEVTNDDNDRAIMEAGIIYGGLITTKHGENNATIIYTATVEPASTINNNIPLKVESGTFILVDVKQINFEQGIYIGHFDCIGIDSNINGTILTIDPAQWDQLLGLSGPGKNNPYKHTAHNINYSFDDIYLTTKDNYGVSDVKNYLKTCYLNIFNNSSSLSLIDTYKHDLTSYKTNTDIQINNMDVAVDVANIIILPTDISIVSMISGNLSKFNNAVIHNGFLYDNVNVNNSLLLNTYSEKIKII